MIRYIIIISLIVISCNTNQNYKQKKTLSKTIETVTLLGDTLISPEIKYGKSYDQLLIAENNYLNNLNDPDALIWYGRRTAYLGYYQEAIKLFTLGIEKYPEDARFYRHRGHRYISIRQYDKAIYDFEQAIELIKDLDDQIEQDGLPNEKNIPLSTLHGNIWYHLGLAYYLKNELNNSLKAFNNRSVTHRYDDNIVSGSHWLYMIQRRLNNLKESNLILNDINKSMDIIENFSYHQSCLFYKGELLESEMIIDEVALYSLANWNLYEKKDTIKAKEYYLKLFSTGNPFSFAYIAGEADWERMFE